jgi:hypothetical protein
MEKKKKDYATGVIGAAALIIILMSFGVVNALAQQQQQQDQGIKIDYLNLRWMDMGICSL